MSGAARLSFPPVPASRPGAEPDNTLAGVLEGLARLHPGAIALRDGAGRETWSGRPARSYTRAAALSAVRDLTSRLLGLGLPPGSAVGICLPAGTEICLAILATERAGLVPVLLPIVASQQDLETHIALVDARAVITQTRIASLRPAETVCAVAARRFRLRFVLAFGPEVPDGVIDLDDGAGSVGRSIEPGAGAGSGIVTFEERGDRSGPMFRPSSSWLAAAASVLAATEWSSRDTVVTWIAPDDLKGLTTGLIACLASGAACEMQAVFDPKRLVASVSGLDRTHLVLPGWTEQAVLRLGLANGAASILFVHDSMAGVSSGVSCPPCGYPVADAVALGGIALLAAPRRADGRPAVVMDDVPAERVVDPRILETRAGLSGSIEARGWASVAVPFQGTVQVPPGAADEWRPCHVPVPVPVPVQGERPTRDDPVSKA